MILDSFSKPRLAGHFEKREDVEAVRRGIHRPGS